MKKILGLDLGTNSIGWTLVELDSENQKGKILGMGSRIVPMDTDLLSNLEQGNSISRTADRRQARSARRLKHRYKLRRQRLIDALTILGWLPGNYKIGSQIPYKAETVTEMKKLFGSDEITDDWTIYYLRKKALTEKIELQELARILLHLNQRRGFKSSRKANNNEQKAAGKETEEQEGQPRRESRVEIVKVISVEPTEEKIKGKTVFSVTLESGLKGTVIRETAPDWAGKDVELEIKTIRTKKETKTEFSVPDKTDWMKLKEALAKDIKESRLHVGEYHLSRILEDRNYRVRERIVDRELYIKELEAIWTAQSAFHPELSSDLKLKEISEHFYKHNTEKGKEIVSNDLLHLIKNDIIYFQRPLKSQKSSIGECRLENKKRFFDIVQNKEITTGYKVAPASSPVFQEFRIWKTLSNLRVMARKKFANEQWQTDVDETELFITPKRELLFELFDSKEKVSLNDILKCIGVTSNTHRLNYPDETTFPGNETKHAFRKVFKRLKFEEGEGILQNNETLYKIWHLVYSVDDETAIKKSLLTKFKLPEEVAEAISKLPPFKLKYAAFSSKALNKLLPLMRSGKYWKAELIHEDSKTRIEKINTGEDDSNIPTRIRELVAAYIEDYTNTNLYQGLPEYLASYIVYGIHSENPVGTPCDKPEDVKIDLKNNSLRNPVVEQMLNETIHVVKDIWKDCISKYGIEKGRIDEIRVELPREYKKTAPERKKIFERNNQNKEDKERVKAILQELNLGNPNSLSDIEKWRIAEENAKYSGFDEEKKPFFRKRSEPTSSEIEKYRLWMSQNCISPYTGEVISLTKLYSSEYEIEHVIPKRLYFDDSFQNKVIVERWANKEKDKLTAMQYIRRGTQIPGKKLLSSEIYITHIEKTFNGQKRKNLLSDTIPDGFIERQLNDTRHISRKAKELLQQITPKVSTSIGSVTDELKQKWGLGKVMKELLLERFERLEKITGEKLISYNVEESGKKHLQLEGYEKRIDHRHHALDALVIACTTQRHIQYLNTLEAGSKDEKLWNQYRKLLKTDKTRDFKQPWEGFESEARIVLEEVLVSYKSKVKLIGKPKNKYFKYIQNEKGQWLKTMALQEESKSENPWIKVRQPLHKETITGTVQFWEKCSKSIKEALETPSLIADATVRKKITELSGKYTEGKDILKALKSNPLKDVEGKELTRIEVWQLNTYAKNRVLLNETFDSKKIAKIAEYNNNKELGLKSLLSAHLAKWQGDSKKAFTGEGLEDLGKTAGKRITKVSIYKPLGNKFEIRPGQFVEAAKGTNLFFIIYEHLETKQREFKTLSLKDVVALKAAGQELFERKEGYRAFTLSPNELIYLPSLNENVSAIDWDQDKKKIMNRIYKFVSCTGNRAYFIPFRVAKPIKDGVEFEALNKIEKSIPMGDETESVSIKHFCIKLNQDRLGRITPLF